MPLQKPTRFPIVFIFFTLITIGIIFSARVNLYAEQDVQTASTKAGSLEPDAGTTDSHEPSGVFSSPLPLARFEPLLLLLLGTLLFSVATSIKFFRSQRPRPRLRSVAGTGRESVPVAPKNKIPDLPNPTNGR